jgi:hypothetical protein
MQTYSVNNLPSWNLGGGGGSKFHELINKNNNKVMLLVHELLLFNFVIAILYTLCIFIYDCLSAC